MPLHSHMTGNKFIYSQSSDYVAPCVPYSICVYIFCLVKAFLWKCRVQDELKKCSYNKYIFSVHFAIQAEHPSGEEN